MQRFHRDRTFLKTRGLTLEAITGGVVRVARIRDSRKRQLARLCN